MAENGQGNMSDSENEVEKIRQIQWFIGLATSFWLIFIVASFGAYLSINAKVVELQVLVRQIEIPPGWFEARVDRLELRVEEHDSELDAIRYQIGPNGGN